MKEPAFPKNTLAYFWKTPRRSIFYPILAAISLTVLTACVSNPNPRLELAVDSPGFDRSILQSAVTAAAHTEHNLHSLLVSRNNKLVVELYRNGWNAALSAGDAIFGAYREMDGETIHDVRSISKSIVGLLVGTSLATHPDITVHTPLRNFPALVDGLPAAIGNIELGQILTMSTGLAWQEWGQGMLTSDETRLYWDKTPIHYYLNRVFESTPGTVFNYSGGSAWLAAEVATRIEGRNIADLARDHIMIPLGISKWQWGKGSNGFYLPYAGLGLKPRDMVKIGQLMLQGGVWEGQQIIPSAWLVEATSPKIKTETDYFSLDDLGTWYGYFWWNGTLDWQGKKIPWFAAVGNGGQRLLVVPALELIIVMTAGEYGNPEIQRWETSLIKHILASVR